MSQKMIFANLVHLSFNMWGDWENRELPQLPYFPYKPYLRFDEQVWREILTAMSKSGFNMVVIDLGDAVQYESHPELAIKGAWTRGKLRDELQRCRDLGLEPIPKLNFSACHDLWLGPYARMVSTPQYYEVCKDVIAEAIDLFDRPRLFHLGMDEEDAEHQKWFEYSVTRQHDLWWRDLKFFCDQVEAKGVRPWMWADYVWVHPEVFWQRMPKSILQSNWYYEEKFTTDVGAVRAYAELEEHQYEQVPTLSNWSTPANIDGTFDFCLRTIAPQRLKGFLLTTWQPTIPDMRQRHLDAIERTAPRIAKLKR